MTPPRPLLLLLAGAALAAGSVATASSDEPTRAGPPADRVAVIAGADVTADTLSGVQGVTTIRRVGGAEEAQAQAAALAAEGYDVVVGLGGQARAAVGQAASAEIGAGTRWATTAP